MPQNRVLVPAGLASAVLTLAPLQLISEAQEQAPAAPAAAGDDMRGIPTSRLAAQGDREFLTPEEFARRAGGDESSRDRAVNQETFPRNKFSVRSEDRSGDDHGDGSLFGRCGRRPSAGS
jgi:hypothetical protein